MNGILPETAAILSLTMVPAELVTCEVNAAPDRCGRRGCVGFQCRSVICRSIFCPLKRIGVSNLVRGLPKVAP